MKKWPVVAVAFLFAMALAVPFWSVGAFRTPFLPEAQLGWVDKVWWWLLVAHLIPILCHLGAQFRCAIAVKRGRCCTLPHKHAITSSIRSSSCHESCTPLRW